ncbi:PepSY domain-containing protein [Croceicoccus sp. Ery15]|uniref:PepSY domain-containing protein n=1 Tax=Croceicoccus sp. Ery15 TaxID=1703338 RepID=UPI001E6054BE|nr:PepSY domain-containing protein [Croceicoccus sp. Ery15]
MKIRWPLFVRRLHKWLALVIGLQVVLWTATGFYMVVVHIDRIHGDHLVKTVERPTLDISSVVAPGTVLAAVPGATDIRSTTLLDRPVWRVTDSEGTQLFDAASGERLKQIDAKQAEAIARSLYTSNDDVKSVDLLTEAPIEMQGREPPYWQVSFDRWDSPTLYISPESGELISRRHSLWRIFDFAWMLHIMDYDDRSDVNNLLLRTSTWLATAMAASGAWLLIWAFPRRRKKKKKSA